MRDTMQFMFWSLVVCGGIAGIISVLVYILVAELERKDREEAK